MAKVIYGDDAYVSLEALADILSDDRAATYSSPVYSVAANTALRIADLIEDREARDRFLRATERKGRVSHAQVMADIAAIGRNARGE
jgi:hypothetical protein